MMNNRKYMRIVGACTAVILGILLCACGGEKKKNVEVTKPETAEIDAEDLAQIAMGVISDGEVSEQAAAVEDSAEEAAEAPAEDSTAAESGEPSTDAVKESEEVTAEASAESEEPAVNTVEESEEVAADAEVTEVPAEEEVPQQEDTAPQEEKKMTFEVVQNTPTEKYEEYVSFCHEEGSDILTGIIDEAKFHKSAGFTKGSLEGYDLDRIREGLGELDYVWSVIEEDENDVILLVILSELDDAAHLRQLHDIGYFTLTDPDNTRYLSVEQLITVYEGKGSVRMDPAEYESLGLHLDLLS